MMLIGIAAVGFFLVLVFGARAVAVTLLLAGTVVVLIASRSSVFDTPQPPTPAQHAAQCATFQQLPEPDRATMLDYLHCH